MSHSLKPVFVRLTIITSFVCMICTSALPSICLSGEYTQTGECCLQCPLGWGVQSRCTDTNNTICNQCYKDITYSPETSHTAGCMPCSRCHRNQFVTSSCNLTHDTECECRKSYYRTLDGSCSQCNTCPPGFGVSIPCTTRQNSRCKSCENGTFSDVTSATKDCLPCRQCPDGSIVHKTCSRFSDTICTADVTFQTPKTSQSTSENPDSAIQSIDDRSSGIVPIYCAILAFVVIGLMGYVVFKRRSFKKLRSHQKQCRSLSGSASKLDVEKTNDKKSKPKRGDNFCNFTSMNDRQCDRTPLLTISKTTPCRHLPRETIAEIESMLGISRLDRRDWRGLALQLGFTDKDIVHFIKTSEDDLPIHRVLTLWCEQEGALVGVLIDALQKLDRIDVLNKLCMQVK
ncbi:tumor necrosis factor receptor superfamily member 16-like isoform X1 [Asterias rubens]|uniref:tumor necrosis factor receptor superfamily member 16-like isoform X1 n=1 Tax=Asterias rubens TaxID=7604 RepID=UPI0014559F96|nr:tumor necrosis factor receptor superfamily member 16-like isoform X1 [Asterias rubens]